MAIHDDERRNWEVRQWRGPNLFETDQDLRLYPDHETGHLTRVRPPQHEEHIHVSLPPGTAYKTGGDGPVDLEEALRLEREAKELALARVIEAGRAEIARKERELLEGALFFEPKGPESSNLHPLYFPLISPLFDSRPQDTHLGARTPWHKNFIEPEKY